MEVIVETGLPVPPSHEQYIRGDTRPRIISCLEQLSIGENILLPATTYNARNHVAEAASRTGKRTGREFTVRLTNDGVRCWRLA